MTQQSFSASALIPAPAQTVYRVIADYRNLHPRILPKPTFGSLDVEQGGYGEGTVINFQMKVMGQIQSFHSLITEPVPGQMLVERDSNRGTTTTFTVEPRQDGKQSFVTIATTISLPDGIAGKIQGWLTGKLLHNIYVKELEQLAKVAAEQT